jgi:hypothetical protein
MNTIPDPTPRLARPKAPPTSPFSLIRPADEVFGIERLNKPRDDKKDRE